MNALARLLALILVSAAPHCPDGSSPIGAAAAEVAPVESRAAADGEDPRLSVFDASRALVR